MPDHVTEHGVIQGDLTVKRGHHAPCERNERENPHAHQGTEQHTGYGPDLVQKTCETMALTASLLPMV